MRIITIGILIVVIVVELVISKRLFGNKYSPLTIFTTVNGLSFVLYCLDFVGYVQMNEMIILVLILDIFFFAIGAFFANSISCSGGTTVLSSFERIDRYIGIIFWIATISTIYIWIRHINDYGISFLRLYLGESLRKGFIHTRFIGNFALLNEFVLPLVVTKAYFGKKVTCCDIIYCLCSILCLLLMVKKTYIICAIIMTFSIVLRYTKRFSMIIKICLFVFIGIVLSFSVNAYLIEYNNNTLMNNIYVYFSGGWAALGQLLRDPIKPLHFGQYTLYNIYKILELFGLSDAGRPEMAGVYIPFWFNVYTMNGEAFVDFGYLGIVLQVTFLGFFCQLLYKKNLRYPTVLNTLIYSILFYCMSLSWFVSEITHFSTLFQILFLLLINYIIKHIRKIRFR